MTKLPRILATLAAVVLFGCSSSGPATEGMPTCPFKIGDTVTRGAVGAIVPPRAQSVNGFGDGPNNSASIQITTGNDGVVTIVTTRNGVGASPEVCRLA